MNKERRKAIEALSSRLDELKGEIESLMQEEQEYFDNMPESFQGGDKGATAESAIEALQEAVDACDTAIEALNAATS
jgi:prefoldin subunit 5